MSRRVAVGVAVCLVGVVLPLEGTRVAAAASNRTANESSFLPSEMLADPVLSEPGRADLGEGSVPPTGVETLRELTAERGPNTDVFDLGNGRRRLRISDAPRFFERDGRWVPIDTTLVPDGDGVRSTATAPTFRLSGDSKVVRASVDSQAGAVSFSPEGSSPSTPLVKGSSATYPGVWPGVSLRYDVTPRGLKETIVAESADAAARPFSFAVDGAVAEAAPKESGAVLQFRQPNSGAVLGMVPPVAVVDSAGVPIDLKPGDVSLDAAAEGSRVVVTAQPSWLASLPRSAFPIGIDPAVYPSVVGASTSFSSTNGAWGSGGYRVQMGKAGGVAWRGVPLFSGWATSPYSAANGWQVTSAFLSLTRADGVVTPITVSAFPNAQPSFALATAGGAPIGSSAVTSGGGGVTITSLADYWYKNGTTSAYVGLVGDESGATGITPFDSTIEINVALPSVATTMAQPSVNDSVLSTLTPTLSANPVANPNGGDTRYRFEIRTPSGDGVVVSSGLVTAPTWQVPAGSLSDNVTYSVRVWTNMSSLADAASPPVRFRTDLNAGSGGPAPTSKSWAEGGDGDGPSAPSPGTGVTKLQVNAATGNLAMSVTGHTVTAPGGSVTPSFTFNSLLRDANGIRGEYFQDVNTNRAFDDSVAFTRSDPVVSFDWGSTSPGGVLQTTNMLARWSGFVRLPASGNWQIGVVTAADPTTDAGARVNVNGSVVSPTSAWTAASTTPVWSSTVTYGGTPLTFSTEYWHGLNGRATVKLLVRDMGATDPDSTIREVPSDWLTATPLTLPKGWTLAVGGPTLRWTGLRDNGGSVTVSAGDGSSLEFMRTVSGFVPPPESSATLVAVNGGFQLYDGVLYTFSAAGAVTAVVAPVDDRAPASLQYQYTGLPPVLSKVVDPVTGRDLAMFRYGSDPLCVVGTNAPGGMLCGISYLDGNQTSLFYNSSGLVTRFITRGSEQYDIGWNASGLPALIRDPLANDAIAAGVRVADATTRTAIEYTGGPNGTAAPGAILGPAPIAGATRTRHTYAYNVGETIEQVCGGISGSCTTSEGFAPSAGFYRRTRYDALGRITEDTDAAGLTTTATWTAKNQMASTTAPNGTRTTRFYDPAGRLTDTWGPAPVAAFNADGTPVNPGAVPRQTTRYDENIAGLAVTYWPNPTLTGAPTKHGTGLTASGGALGGNWGSTPPVSGVGGWSLRATGLLTAPAAGLYLLKVAGYGSTSLWIDDALVTNAVDDDGVSLWENTASVNLTAGVHRIRLDFTDTGGLTAVDVLWRPPGAPSYVTIPGTQLAPNYGLTTTSIDADNVTTRYEYTDATAGIGAEFGLRTATVQDPTGLGLRETTAYETPSASTYLRRLSRTLPGGTTNTYSYYQTADPVPANNCGVSSAIDQRGRAKQRTYPDPDGAGPLPPRVEQYLYDSAGRTVGNQAADLTAISATGWTCTTYDNRGRVTQVTVPARSPEPARTVTTAYATSGNPLKVAQSDSTGTISAGFDIVGRMTSYTDTAGAVTSTTFDSLGRQSSTSGPNGVIDTTYEAATGRPDLTKLGGVTQADTTYDSAGRLSGVAYSNSTQGAFGFDSSGRPISAMYTGPSSSRVAGDQVTRSLAGRVTDQLIDTGGATLVDFDPAGPNYVYDGAGRLTGAQRADRSLSYSFSGNYAGCNGNPNAGRNTNRQSITEVFNEGSGSNNFCYDWADRLVATTRDGGVTYDSYGNTATTNAESLTYDGANRQASSIRERQAILYKRDAADRIVERRSYGSGATTWPVNSIYSAPTTTVTLGKPTALPNNTLLIAALTLPAGVTATTPSGWTAVASTTTGVAVQYIWRRTSPTTDPTSWTVTLSASSTAAASVLGILGADTANPIDATAVTSTTTGSSTHTAPSVAVTGEARLVLRLDALNAATSTTPPSPGVYEPSDIAAGAVSQHVLTQIQPVNAAAPALTYTTTAPAAGHHRTIAVKLAGNTERYRFNGPGDAPAVTTNDTNVVIDKAVSLPGGVRRIERPDGTRWAYPNLHGDMIATATATGTKIGSTATFDPDGNADTRTDAYTSELDTGYLGQFGKLQERSADNIYPASGIIQMGARLYNPAWGRFLSIDPIEGGCANDYAYGYGDPVNGSDLDGRWWVFDDVGDWVKRNSCKIGQVAGAVAFGLGAAAALTVLVASGGTVALILAGAAIGASAVQLGAGIVSGNRADIIEGGVGVAVGGIGGALWGSVGEAAGKLAPQIGMFGYAVATGVTGKAVHSKGSGVSKGKCK